MDVVLQRKGQAGRAGPRCVWPMCHVCGRRPTPPCVGGRGPLGCQLRPPALQETRPSQVRPCLLPLLGAFVNSGLSITKAPKRRKLNNGGGASPPTLPPQKVINVMRAEDGERPCCAWATPSALRMSPLPAPPPHTSAHRTPSRPWQLPNRPLSLAALSHARLVSRVQPVLRAAWAWSGKGWVSPSFGLCLALCLV